MKMPKFGSKKNYLGIFGLEFENNIVLFEISTSILATCKISRKNKNT